MFDYLIKRIISAIIVIWGVLTLVFFTLHLTPGDPIEVMLGERAQISDKQALREQLNLHLPIHQQYKIYLLNLMKGDLGTSLHQKKNISQIISQRIGNTAILAFSSIIFAIFLAIPLGIWAAQNKGRWQDSLALNVSLMGISIPNFVLGPLLILVFSLFLKWLPTGGNSQASSLILPTIALGTAMMAVLSRLMRSSLLEVWNETYLLAARARGLSSRQVIWRHALPNALLPVITIIGIQLGTLLGGAVITEVVFSWPGIGSALVQAIENRDYPLIQSCILVIAIAYTIINLITDIIYSKLDPRIRLESNSTS